MRSADKEFQGAIDALNNRNMPRAELLLKKVLRRHPRHFEALSLLAIVLMFMERHAEAEPLFKSALAVNADNDATLSNYGMTLKTLNRPEEAIAVFTRALAINPANAVTWNNRGTTLYDLKRYQNAIEDFNKATSLEPRFFDAFCSMGNSLGQLKRYDEAFAAYDKALALNPDLAEAWHGLGTLFTALSRPDDAFLAYDKAFGLKPDLMEVEGLRLQAKMHLCDWRDFAIESRHLVESARKNGESTEPFTFIALDTSAEDQLKFARMWLHRKYPSRPEALWRGEIYNHDRIRIGYVSSDYKIHPMAFLLSGMFESHDKSRFEVTGISIGKGDGSDTRERIINAFDRFIDAGELTDHEVATQIKQAEIDILIDMNAFTQGARPEIFASRPSPIQVNYLGYPGTMGASFIDYIVADSTLIPASHRNFYSEKVAYLPHTYQPNDSKRQISERVFTRSECGLADGKFVFCCFNNAYKILPDVFDRWMRILKQVDGSVLWLLQANPTAVTNLRREAAARGVDGDRLVFAERMPLSDHLARHRLADLFLDTLPYNAHTTTSDALWTGLPVLTQVGGTFAGRVAASLLKAIELPELIAETAEAYDRLASELALNPEKLASIKARLDRHRLTTPLFNTQQYTRHIESAYAAMWERYRNGLAPDHIFIPA